MASAKATVRRWGASLGTVIPKPIVEELRLKEGDEIRIDVQRRNPLLEVFGRAKDWRVDPQRLKDEMRKGW